MKVFNIYCVARNYKEHAKEMKSAVPEEPIFFQKPSVCVTTEPILYIPPDKEIHYELEIVARITKPGYQIPQELVWDHVGELCLGLDLTDRPLQTKLKKAQLPWFLAKSFLGSAVLTQFKPIDFKLWENNFWLKIDGTIVQSAYMKDMIFSIPFLIEYLSARIPLMENDIIFTGTPSGVGSLNDEDKLSMGIGDTIESNFLVTLNN
ncbi:MAG: fumarylacetoacetate hydrolase family protein [Candidatus Marinimicrobia bacterium]|nr:fumarylacetoacetate hydrolase family protein [Candidatus Neomarinimicrobiota bacterium]